MVPPATAPYLGRETNARAEVNELNHDTRSPPARRAARARDDVRRVGHGVGLVGFGGAMTRSRGLYLRPARSRADRDERATKPRFEREGAVLDVAATRETYPRASFAKRGTPTFEWERVSILTSRRYSRTGSLDMRSVRSSQMP